MYNDVEERNRFISDFKIPIFYDPIDYGSLPTTVIKKDQDWDNISKIYQQEKIVVVDNFLEYKFVDMLRKYALITNVRDDFYMDYCATNFFRTQGSLWFKLLSNIVDESKSNIPLLTDYNFERAWSFIYSNVGNGVNIHSDPANVTFNLWVTPNECMYDEPEFNGLEIWKVSRPSNWSPEKYTGSTQLASKLIEEKKTTSTIIPYKHNRLVIFDSSFFHRSLPVRTKPGYQNKRINYTFLYS
jgi:hypothetical protein